MSNSHSTGELRAMYFDIYVHEERGRTKRVSERERGGRIWDGGTNEILYPLDKLDERIEIKGAGRGEGGFGIHSVELKSSTNTR